MDNSIWEPEYVPKEPVLDSFLIPAEDFDRVQAELAALEEQHTPVGFPQLDAIQLAAGKPLFPDMDFSMVSEEKLAAYTEAESRVAARLYKGLAHRYRDSKFKLVSRRVQVEPNVTGDGI